MTTHKGQPARQHGDLSRMLGKVLLMERSGRRWSREEMARRSGLSAKTIQRIEDGDRVADVTQVRNLAAAFGMSTSALLGIAEERVSREAAPGVEPEEAHFEDVPTPADRGASPQPRTD